MLCGAERNGISVETPPQSPPPLPALGAPRSPLSRYSPDEENAPVTLDEIVPCLLQDRHNFFGAFLIGYFYLYDFFFVHAFLSALNI